MAIPEEHIEKVMHVLTEWNPLGDRATTVRDLNNYRTEAVDILFSIGMPGSPTNFARTVQSTLNQAFGLELSLDDCLEAAAEIKQIVN
jgi:hypothetical protein